VRNGQSNLANATQAEHLSAGFVTEKAPRTVLGHDAVGRVMVMEFDGEEDIHAGFGIDEA
jgi:hypothetical protein